MLISFWASVSSIEPLYSCSNRSCSDFESEAWYPLIVFVLLVLTVTCGYPVAVAWSSEVNTPPTSA